ncbi:MAG: hypothetical protein ABIR79_16500 [Candidatus Binatia bacterium]
MCGAEFPRTDLDGGGNVRVQTCAVIDGATLQISASVPALPASSSTTVPVSFTACDPMQHYIEVADLTAACTLGLLVIVVTRMAFWPLWQNQ